MVWNGSLGLWGSLSDDKDTKPNIRSQHAFLEYLTASLCHKTATFDLDAPEDVDDETEAVEQESLFTAFAPVKVSTPRTEELFPKGWKATLTVEVREGTSRIRKITLEPEEGVIRKMLEEGKKVKEENERGGREDVMEL